MLCMNKTEDLEAGAAEGLASQQHVPRVSASSRHARQSAAGQRGSAQPAQSGEGLRPMRCSHYSEADQWPARSWWMSTAAPRPLP